MVQSARAQGLFQATDDEKQQREWANELMEWADLDDSFILDTFPLKKRISPHRFYNMARENNYFSQCLSYAKARIGERLQMKLINDRDYIKNQIPKLDALTIEYEQKKQEAARATQATVVERYIELPNCGLKEK